MAEADVINTDLNFCISKKRPGSSGHHRRRRDDVASQPTLVASPPGAFEGVGEFDGGGNGAVVEAGERSFEVDDCFVQELDYYGDEFPEVA